MKKILFINACVRPKSRTYRLAKQVLDQMEGTVEEVNLEQEKIKPLDWETLQLRDDCVSRKEFAAPLLRYARQFIEADGIVCYKAENLDIKGADADAIMQKAMEEIVRA